jgi:uncharacterized membrane protein YgcG
MRSLFPGTQQFQVAADAWSAGLSPSGSWVSPSYAPKAELAAPQSTDTPSANLPPKPSTLFDAPLQTTVISPLVARSGSPTDGSAEDRGATEDGAAETTSPPLAEAIPLAIAPVPSLPLNHTLVSPPPPLRPDFEPSTAVAKQATLPTLENGQEDTGNDRGDTEYLAIETTERFLEPIAIPSLDALTESLAESLPEPVTDLIPTKSISEHALDSVITSHPEAVANAVAAPDILESGSLLPNGAAFPSAVAAVAESESLESAIALPDEAQMAIASGTPTHFLTTPTPSESADSATAPIASALPLKAEPVRPARTRKNAKIWAWVGGSVAIATLATAIGYGWQRQAYLKVETQVRQLAILEDSQQYEACIQQASAIPQRYAQLKTEAEAIRGNCLLAQAQALAQQRQFKAAIAQAEQIQPPMPAHNMAQQQIQDWSNQILQTATQQYRQGKLQAAMTIIQAIPDRLPLATTAQTTVQQWQTESQKNETLLKTAQQALEKRQWQAVLDTLKQVRVLNQPVSRNSPYWNANLKDLTLKAEQGMAKDKAAAEQAAREAARAAQAAPSASSSESGGTPYSSGDSSGYSSGYSSGDFSGGSSGYSGGYSGGSSGYSSSSSAPPVQSAPAAPPSTDWTVEQR